MNGKGFSGGDFYVLGPPTASFSGFYDAWKTAKSGSGRCSLSSPR
jgi:hypothetical protein